MLNLKIFHALNVLDKLQGLWVSQNSEVLYVLATRITFICAMTFEAFPLDVQTCLFQVSYAINLSPTPCHSSEIRGLCLMKLSK